MPVMEPPVMLTKLEGWVAIVPRPRFARAPDASEAPVPPSAMARSLMPAMEPPVMLTAMAFWRARDPSPRLDRADGRFVRSERLLAPRIAPRFAQAPAASDAPVPPSAMARSVMPVMVPPVMWTRLAACVAREPMPRAKRAPAALDAPVPPSARGTGLAKEMTGVAPPLEASGEDAVTEVTPPPPPPPPANRISNSRR